MLLEAPGRLLGPLIEALETARSLAPDACAQLRSYHRAVQQAMQGGEAAEAAGPELRENLGAVREIGLSRPKSGGGAAAGAGGGGAAAGAAGGGAAAGAAGGGDGDKGDGGGGGSKGDDTPDVDVETAAADDEEASPQKASPKKKRTPKAS